MVGLQHGPHGPIAPRNAVKALKYVTGIAPIRDLLMVADLAEAKKEK